jgi:hypothetical protein
MASLRFLLAMGLLWLPLPPEELPLTIASGLELVRFLGVEGALDTMPGDCFIPLPACYVQARSDLTLSRPRAWADGRLASPQVSSLFRLDWRRRGLYAGSNAPSAARRPTWPGLCYLPGLCYFCLCVLS